MRFLKILLFLALPTVIFSQSKIDGLWKGVITQDSPDGQSTEFQIEIRIYKTGKRVSGETTVHWGDKFAKMSFGGKIERGVLVEMDEKEVLNKSEIPGYDWCLKQMKLILKETEPGKLILEGYWQGKSSFGNCDPGKLSVEKQIDRV